MDITGIYAGALKNHCGAREGSVFYILPHNSIIRESDIARLMSFDYGVEVLYRNFRFLNAVEEIDAHLQSIPNEMILKFRNYKLLKHTVLT